MEAPALLHHQMQKFLILFLFFDGHVSWPLLIFLSNCLIHLSGLKVNQFINSDILAWIDKNKLTIEEESKGLIDDDGHYSREGNLLIADKV